MIIIYPIIITVFLIYGCRFMSAEESRDKFLNPRQADMLRAFACLGVIIHHLTQTITSYGEINKGPVTIFSSMGILFTAVFFFFSGYGLLISYYTKENYLQSFLLKRLTTVLIPFFTANTVYVIVKSIQNGRMESLGQTLSYIFGITLINSNGWYIVEIVILYLAFYILFRLLGNKDIALVLLCLFTFALIIIAKQRGHDNALINPYHSWFKGEWWYNSTICFVLGLLFARFKDFLVKIYDRFSMIFLAVSVPLFVLVFYAEEKIRKRYGYYRESFTIDNSLSSSTITLIWQMLLCVCFVFFLVNLSYKISFSNKFMLFIAGISNEIFLIHNVFVKDTIGNVRMTDFLRYFLVLVLSVLSGFILSKINKPLIGFVMKLGSTKSGNKSQDIITLEREMLIQRKIRRTKCIKTAMIAFVVVIIVLAGLSLRRTLLLKKLFKDEVTSLQNAKVGDTILFGSYPTDMVPGDDRLEWIIVDKSDTMVTMVTRDGISGETYNRKHTEVSWEEADLRNKLNSEYTDVFSDYEKSLLIANECGDTISLMTVKQAVRYFENDASRMLFATDAAKKDNVNVNNLSKADYWDYKEDKSSWWWLRGEEGYRGITTPIVNADGEIEENKKPVNKPNGAVRPIIIVEIPEVE